MEFAGENLVVSSGKLFCQACREELNIKKSSVKYHMKSAKHAEGKRKIQLKRKCKQNIALVLQKHNAELHERGEMLPLAQQVYCFKMVQSFLRAAVPLNKLECFQYLLEENAYGPSSRRHMSDLVSFILKDEQAHIKHSCDS